MSKTPVRADVAARLKKARQRIFSTAADAAQALDMKPVTLRAHENAQNGVNIYDLERYARRFNVSLQWLLTGQGDETPDPQVHVELGEMIEVEITVEPKAWIPNDDPARTRQKFRGVDVPEIVPFTDPRFPAAMVQAFKIGSASPVAHYISGTILFVIDVSRTGFNNGDHVIVIRERGDFTNISVRRALRSDGKLTLESLTDPGEPDLAMEATEKEELPHISAIVIGSLTRRPVRTVDVEEIRNFEAYERSRHFGPKEWRESIREAKAIVSGKKSPVESEMFDSVEDAELWLASQETDTA